MKKVLGLLSLTFLLFACNDNSGDPRHVLKQFFAALSAKNIQEAKKYVTKDSEPMLNMLEKGLKMAPDSANNAYEVSNMDFGEAKIDGSTARVPVTDKRSGEGVSFLLKKENDDWKVAFDKATLMQLATEKMKESGMDAFPSAPRTPSFDTDSIRKAIEGMSPEEKEMLQRGLDSAGKALQELKEAGKIKF